MSEQDQEYLARMQRMCDELMRRLEQQAFQQPSPVEPSRFLRLLHEHPGLAVFGGMAIGALIPAIFDA